MLRLSGICQQNDLNKYAGMCSYADLECPGFRLPDGTYSNLCNTVPQACGGKSYYCVKIGSTFGWSEDSGNCKVLPGEEEKPKYSISKGEPEKELAAKSFYYLHTEYILVIS